MKLDFTEKTVLVTGASMGIGRGLAGCFARDGANLALIDLPARKTELDAFADELERAAPEGDPAQRTGKAVGVVDHAVVQQ